jgi:hypothetical protein
MGQHDKDIRNYGPCLRPYDWHRRGDGQSAHRSSSCALQYWKLLIQMEVAAMKESSPRGRMVVKAERFGGNREARQALALSIAGVMTIMMIWNLIMVYLY